MKIFVILVFLFSLCAHAELIDPNEQTKTPEDDQIKIAEYQSACKAIDTYIVRKLFKVDCFSNYQHYGPTTKSLKVTGTLRIAGYNLLHPGTSKALFKDYSLVAKIINKYDVVSGLELLGTVGHDEVNNQAVLAFINSSPKLINDLKNKLKSTKNPAQAKIINDKISKLTSDTQSAYSLYRAPGYLKILWELKKLDPSWALLISPRGDSALQGSVEELVGFFYRANSVTPTINPHCNEFKDANGGTPYACILNLSSKFMDKDYTHHFARRPFMASFRSGTMKFTMISMHVVFNFSGDDADEKKLMNDVFGVDAYTDLNNGVTGQNFARFAEVKTTLSFMDRFRKKYNDKNIMFVSDTNLTPTIPFWSEILKSFPGGSLLINNPTTISPPRYSADGKETNGVASSYDHFVLDKKAFSTCNDGDVYNYYKSDIESDIERIYMIRPVSAVSSSNLDFSLRDVVNPVPPPDDGTLVNGDVPPDDDSSTPTPLDYPMSAAGANKMNRIVNYYASQLPKMLTIQGNEVVPDDYQIKERVDGLKRRVFTNQLTNPFYYRFYQEILSDHFPVSITCKN